MKGSGEYISTQLPNIKSLENQINSFIEEFTAILHQNIGVNILPTICLHPMGQSVFFLCPLFSIQLFHTVVFVLCGLVVCFSFCQWLFVDFSFISICVSCKLKF